MGKDVGGMAEMSLDRRRKGGGESRAVRWPGAHFGVRKQWSSSPGTSSS
jgi:hypothetical protein